MLKRFFSILQYIFFLGGGLFLVWWQLRSMTEIEKTEFYGALKNANYWMLIPVILMSIASHISRSMRWQILMKPLDYRPKLKNVFSVTMIGYLVNSAIPRLGEVIKCTLLAKHEKLRADKLIGTIIIERTFDLICYILFICITILIQLTKISDFVKEKINNMSQSSGMPVWLEIIIIAGIIIFFVLLIKFLFKKYPENKLIIKINNIIKGIAEGFKTIRKIRKRKAFLLHTLFIWLMYLAQIFIGFKSMDGIDHLGIHAAFSVLSLATLSMILTPGGIGSFPIFVMQTLSVYAIAPTLGKAFGWLMWGVSTGIILIAGLICLAVLPYINREKSVQQ